MHNPTKAQVQVVIDTLNKAAEMAEGNCPVDMFTPYFNKVHPCGSPACHGGWYAIVHGLNYYEDGADRMAQDLGFADAQELKDWAKENSDIWGFPNGDNMFCDGCAFGWNDDNGTLQQIIQHWHGVQSRLPQ